MPITILKMFAKKLSKQKQMTYSNFLEIKEFMRCHCIVFVVKIQY